MLHTLSISLVVLAFIGAGLFNAIGTRATQDDFARWGHPRWWCRVTEGLEIVSAGLIAFPANRETGLALGAVIIVTAAVTVLCRREFAHAAPLGVFTALLALAAVS
ncbi:DoxX family protein [Roseomonas sp. WA12]